jgi:predicted small metal-binding protein
VSTDAKVIECPCGVVLEGATADEVVDAAQQHAQEAHELELSRESALSMARPA